MFESVFDAVSHFHRQNLNEGPMDSIKGAASKVGGALKTGAKAVGGAISGAAKQVTTKVTAEKLMTAWKKADSPTDSAEVYDVIKGLGVADDVIKGTYDSMKIEVPGTTDAPDADKDADAADQSTDDPNATTAGDAGDQATDTPAPGAAGAEAPTGDTATSSTDPATGNATSSKDERYVLQKNANDETKVDIIDKQTSKPVKDGVALDPEKAEPMSDNMNKEAGAFTPKGERYTMQPSAADPKKFDVVDAQTDKPIKGGVNVEPGAAEELSDKMNSQTSTSTATDTTATNTTTTDKPAADGATDANTASTSGDQGADATTTATDPVDANNDGIDDNTGNPVAQNRGAGQGKDTAAPGGTPGGTPANINDLAAQIKKLDANQQEDAKKFLAA